MYVLNNDNQQQTLQDYPCDYLFKAFGPSDPAADFFGQVHSAVNQVVPVGRDAIKQRPSSKGTYLCVSVATYLHNEQQRQAIYRALQSLEGLKYLL